MNCIGGATMEKQGYLDYKIEIQKLSDDEGGGFLAIIPELPGCMSDGETYEKALANAKDAISCWIDTARELGREIPNPKLHESTEKFSGKLTLRLPKYLHRKLAERAKEEDCSINQLIQSYISFGLGKDYGNNNITFNIEYQSDKSQTVEKINENLESRWQDFCRNRSFNHDLL